MEGILMRGVDRQAIVCRGRGDGYVTKVGELKLVKEKYPVLGLPLIRGVVNFLGSMTQGVSALMWSAEQLPEEEQEEPDKLELWLRKHFPDDRAEKAIIAFAVVLGILLSVGLFSVLPTLLAGLLARFLPLGVFRGLAEGLLRLVIFLLYLWLCSRLQDIRRVWMYHGAEHKTIFCYEHGKELTVENARMESRFHPRCGTSFLFLVVFVSIVVFSLITTENTLVRLGLHLLLLPVIVSVSYELIKLAGRYDNAFTRIISAPGKALQKLTTAEPDDEMLEIAIAALKLVLPEKEGSDAW